MNKKIVTVALFFSINVFAADVNLSGTVKKEDGNPIAGARISLKNNPTLVSFTNEQGGFVLSGSVDGNFTSDSIVVITRGYRTVLLKIASYGQADIAVTQIPSNTWIPSESPERMGSMVKIKAKGYDFEMGQPCDTVRGTFWDMPTTDIEQPVHTVFFTYDFWMDTVEITQGEYDTVMKTIYGKDYIRPTWNGSNGLGRNWPAYSVEWGSAVLFCNARSKFYGLPDTAYSYSRIIGSMGSLCTLQNVKVNLHANAFRLPTEAEWEYACRAGTTTDFYWGKDFNPYPATAEDTAEVNSYAVWSANSFDLGKETIIRHGPGLDSSYYGTHEVGKKKPNAYGLYDMVGNVSEWCNDLLNNYPWGAATDPTGVVPDDPSGYLWVSRGGNWSNDVTYLRSTERQFAASDYQFLFVGFRTVSSGPGFVLGIRKEAGFPAKGSKKPDIIPVRSGFRLCNAAGCEAELFSLLGTKVRSFKPGDGSFTFDKGAISPGSYIIKIKRNKNELSRKITLLP